jgi:beta-lactamase superfamily II metal-dependent hydrolase
MPYEIDFLAVGDKTSGDAICLRYGPAPGGAFTIHIVDGGFQDCGDEIIAHLTTHFGNPNFIDHVVLSHSDNDHAGGLIKVLEEYDCRVGALWMNRPWVHAREIVDLFKYGWTAEGLEKKLRELYPTLLTLEKMATKAGIPIYDVFQGTQIGAFRVLAPSKSRYLSLIPQFDKTPAALVQEISTIGTLFKAVVRFIKETWTGETLSENPDPPTSASNESSVVQFAQLDASRILLTGDVGPDGLHEAADYGALLRVDRPTFVQVPHHGSRRNVTPSALNRWLGNPLQNQTDKNRGIAFCSAAKNDEDHPRKKVINAFTRRGYPVHATKGTGKRQYHGMLNRNGWSTAVALEFSNEVEE